MNISYETLLVAVEHVIFAIALFILYRRKEKARLDDIPDKPGPPSLWNTGALFVLVFAMCFLPISLVFEQYRVLILTSFYILFHKNLNHFIPFDSHNKWEIKKMWRGELSLAYTFFMGFAILYCIIRLYLFVCLEFLLFVQSEIQLRSHAELFQSKYALLASLMFFLLPVFLSYLMILLQIALWKSAKLMQEKKALGLPANILSMGIMLYFVYTMYLHLLTTIRWF